MADKMHLTSLGSLKSRMEWSAVIPGKVWGVEGYTIVREGKTRYVVKHKWQGGQLAVCRTLTESFEWIADQIF